MAELGDIQIPDELLKAIAGGVLTPTTEKHLIELAAFFKKRGDSPEECIERMTEGHTISAPAIIEVIERVYADPSL